MPGAMPHGRQQSAQAVATGVIIEDAGSTNGCFVNGKQVRKHLLHEGDVLELGDLRYRLRTRSSSDTRARANVVPFDKPTG